MQNMISIVLAGGQSTRMGTDKALLKLHGTTLIQQVANTMQALQAPVYISVATEAYQFLKLPLLVDKIKNIGPISALHTAMLSTNAEWYAVASCDSPLLNLAAYKHIIAKCQGQQLACIAASHNRHHPLIGIYNRNILPHIQAAIARQEYGLMQLLSKLPHQVIQMQSVLTKHNSQMLANVNTPEDYKLLCNHKKNEK